MHIDFHAENVLVDAAGTVTGVIDWDGAVRGDGDFDLVTLRFDLAGRAPHLLAGVPDTMTPAAWAHMSLRLVDWAIRHHSASDVTRRLDLADRLRPR